MDEAARQRRIERLRAVGALWLGWLAAYLSGELILAALLAREQGLALRLSGAAGSTVAAASGPLLVRLGAAQVPFTVQVGLVNTLALLVCFALTPMMSAASDPQPRGALAARLDRTMWTSPALRWTNYVAYLFWPMPTFRRTPTLRLKGMCAFGALPFLFPVLMGLQASLVGGSLLSARQAQPLSSALVGLALVLPHGLLEMTAFFIPVGALLELYRRLRPPMLAGDAEGVSTVLREHGSWKAAWRGLPVALGLLLAAAAIEANLTLPLAEAVARALGLSLRG